MNGWLDKLGKCSPRCTGDSMASIEKDLRTYLARTQKEGELLSIDKRVDPYTEAPALLQQSVKRGKALLFKSVSGSAMPVLGNTLASRQWIETALGCGNQGILSWLGERSTQGIPAAIVETGPVKEVIEDAVDLQRFPILTFHEEDGGPYITGGIGPESRRESSTPSRSPRTPPWRRPWTTACSLDRRNR